MKKKTIPVFFAVDDNYVDFLKVALTSIIENAKDESYRYTFNILHNGLSKQSKKSLKHLSHKRFKIYFHNVINLKNKIKNDMDQFVVFYYIIDLFLNYIDK